DFGSKITFTFHGLKTLAAKRHKNAAHGASRGYTTMQWAPCGAKGRSPNGLIELSLRRGLLGPDATSSNLCHKITLTFYRSPRHPPQHRDLPNVRQSIRDWPLKQFFRCGLEWAVGSQKIVKGLQPRKEPLDVLIPVLHPRVPPCLLPACNRQAPVQQIADMREYLPGHPARFTATIVSKIGRRIMHRLAAAIGQCGQGMPQQFAFRIGIASHENSLRLPK